MSAVDRFLAEAAEDDQVLGVLLSGSRADELHDERSDWDVYVLVRRPRPNERRGPLELSHWTLESIEEIGWWTPGLVYARVLLDKTGELPARLARLSAAAAGDPNEHWDAYLNSFIRSARAWQRGDELGARLHASDSLAWLAKALFALEGRVAPYLDRLVVHLPDGWRPAFLEIARTADLGAQRALQARVEALMESHGIRTHEEWDPAQLARAKRG